jgi:hypothetical protein
VNDPTPPQRRPIDKAARKAKLKAKRRRKRLARKAAALLVDQLFNPDPDPRSDL